MTKVVIAGFMGRMGQAAVKMVKETPEFELVGLIDPNTAETEIDGAKVFNKKKAYWQLKQMLGLTSPYQRSLLKILNLRLKTEFHQWLVRQALLTNKLWS